MYESVATVSYYVHFTTQGIDMGGGFTWTEEGVHMDRGGGFTWTGEGVSVNNLTEAETGEMWSTTLKMLL